MRPGPEPDEPGFRLGLAADEEPPGEPAGFVMPVPAALALLRRLRPRLERYRSLRLALAAGEAILFAAEPAPLPWTGAARLYLRLEGALLLPFGRRLDVPAAWRAEVARRLLDAHGLKAPALLLPGERGLHLVDLAPSRALPEIDLDRIAPEGPAASAR